MPRVTIPTEFAIALRPTGGKRDLAQLRKLLFANWLWPFLRNRIKYVPRTSHTNALGTTEYMVEADLARKPDRDRIVYRLVPAGADACDLSRVAAHHWLELALAANLAHGDDLAGWMSTFGYQLAEPPPPLAELLARARPLPLVEVAPPRKVLIGAVPGAPDRIIVDEGVAHSGSPSWPPMTASASPRPPRAAYAPASCARSCASGTAERRRRRGRPRSQRRRPSLPSRRPRRRRPQDRRP